MNKKQDEIIARLILNTKRNKRLNNLVEIARDIEQLAQIIGGVEKVANLIGLSSHMLNQFLSVNRLSNEVKKKVINRDLDSVSVVNYIAKYTPEEQNYLADNYIKGELTSQDIRAIGPLRTQFPKKSIKDLMDKVLSSKNIKVSVFYVQLPKQIDIPILTNKIETIVGEENIISIDAKGYLGIIKLTKNGEDILRENIKKEGKGMSMKTYLQYILNQ